MEILGIGPMELMFIAVIALILMGPKEMAKAGKTIGAWLNDFVRSDTWMVLKETSKTVRDLPTQLMREANFEESLKNRPANDRPANPALEKFKLEDQDAIAKAPPQNLPPRPADLEPGEADKTILAPSRSLAVDAPPPVPASLEPVPSVPEAGVSDKTVISSSRRRPVSTDATFVELNPVVAPTNTDETLTAPAKMPRKRSSTTSKKSKRDQKSNE